MSRIDDLIADLCPDGVEFRALGEVGTFVRGNGLQKSDLVDRGAGAIHYGQIHTHYGTWATQTKSYVDPALAARLRRAKTGDLVVATTSEDDAAVAKAVAWIGEDEVAVSGDAYIYSHELDPKYMAYFFQSDQFQGQKQRHVTGAKVRRISGEALARIRLPVPPLEVQREIVRVLDTFTELEAELEAELETRRRQYAHYRHSLMASAVITEHLPLGDALELLMDYRGRTPKKLGGQWTTSGHRVISALNVKGGRVDDNDHHYIDPATYLRWMRSPLRAGDVLLTSEAPLGAVAYLERDVDWAVGQRLFVLRSKPGLVNGRYLYHLLAGGPPRGQLFARATGSTVTGIRQAELVQLPIPVPPLAEQERIVGILDQFDALVNDSSVGLPAELAARRTQYEHYRDRLLTFRELAA